MNPTDRSISPQISSSTSPIAMIAIGAMISESRSTAFVWVTNVELCEIPKYSSSATVTTRTVASRCLANTPRPRATSCPPPFPLPPPPPSAPRPPRTLPPDSTVPLTSPPGAFVPAQTGDGRPACRPGTVARRRLVLFIPRTLPGSFSGAGGCRRVADRAGGPRHVLLCGGGALVPAGHVVLGQVALRDEGQASVGVGRDERAAGDVVQVHVQRGQEPLQVRVLVDGEAGGARLDVGQRLRDRVEAAVREVRQPGFGERLRQERG